MSPRYLRRHEAASYVRSVWGLPCAATWLTKLACVSTDGPAFVKAGRTPLYERTDLDEWAMRRISKKVRSTSEL